MRVYIRNRSRYNPETAESDLVHIDVYDPARTSIDQLKEAYKTITTAHKLDELFLIAEHQALRLEDGRSVAHYNIRHEEILESTSNPFFAACMYILKHEADKLQRDNPGDGDLLERMRKSIIHKHTILQVIFNSKKDDGVTQPAKFNNVDEFVMFVRSHHKKGMEMSEMTVQKLHHFWEDFHQNHLGTQDPIRSFVSRYRNNFNFNQNHNVNNGDDDDGFYDDNHMRGYERGRLGHHRGNRGRGRGNLGNGGRGGNQNNLPGAENALGDNQHQAAVERARSGGQYDDMNGPGYGGKDVPRKGQPRMTVPVAMPVTEKGNYTASQARGSAESLGPPVAATAGKGTYSVPHTSGNVYPPLDGRVNALPPGPLPRAGQGCVAGRLPPQQVGLEPPPIPHAGRGGGRDGDRGLARAGNGQGHLGLAQQQQTRPTTKAKTRKKKEMRKCDNCVDDVAASTYCPDCEGGMALCAECADFTHQGGARARHQLRDISEAPKMPKKYTPHAYMSPFALLLGLFEGYRNTPAILSMTEDELRQRAQAATDTDLSDKNTGKMFGGFDSMEGLITKKLVRREATGSPTYALTELGRELAHSLQKFHNETYRFLQNSTIPNVPPMKQMEDFMVGTRLVCLLIDKHEKQKDRLLSMARAAGATAQVRELPVGDYLWVLLPPGVNREGLEPAPHYELVLPHIVERKTWDDLEDSLRNTRFRRQVDNIKRCGVRDRFYLVEGDVNSMRNKPSPEQKQFLQGHLTGLLLEDDFHTVYTGSWLKTAFWLIRMSYIATLQQRQAMPASRNLMTYTEFSRKARGEACPEDTTPYRLRTICHKWQADKFIQVLFRGVERGNWVTTMREELGVLGERISPQEKHLLIIQGLEAYNKGRSKLLNDCLGIIVNQSERNPKEVVQSCLSDSLQKLVHYDVQSYATTQLQVYVGVYVHRTENNTDTFNLEQDFLTSGKNAGDSRHHLLPSADEPGDLGLELGQGRDQDPDDDDDSDDDQPPGGGAAGIIAQADFAADSQSEADILRKVMEASLAEAPPALDQEHHQLDLGDDFTEYDEDTRRAIRVSLLETGTSNKTMNMIGHPTGGASVSGLNTGTSCVDDEDVMEMAIKESLKNCVIKSVPPVGGAWVGSDQSGDIEASRPREKKESGITNSLQDTVKNEGTKPEGSLTGTTDTLLLAGSSNASQAVDVNLDEDLQKAIQLSMLTHIKKETTDNKDTAIQSLEHSPITETTDTTIGNRLPEVSSDVLSLGIGNGASLGGSTGQDCDAEDQLRIAIQLSLVGNVNIDSQATASNTTNRGTSPVTETADEQNRKQPRRENTDHCSSQCVAPSVKQECKEEEINISSCSVENSSDVMNVRPWDVKVNPDMVLTKAEVVKSEPGVMPLVSPIPCDLDDELRLAIALSLQGPNLVSQGCTGQVNTPERETTVVDNSTSGLSTMVDNSIDHGTAANHVANPMESEGDVTPESQPLFSDDEAEPQEESTPTPVMISPIEPETVILLDDSQESSEDGSTFETSVLGLDVHPDFIQEQQHLLEQLKQEKDKAAESKHHSLHSQGGSGPQTRETVRETGRNRSSPTIVKALAESQRYLDNHPQQAQGPPGNGATGAEAGVQSDLVLAQKLQASYYEQDCYVGGEDDERLASQIQAEFDSQLPTYARLSADRDAELARRLAEEDQSLTEMIRQDAELARSLAEETETKQESPSSRRNMAESRNQAMTRQESPSSKNNNHNARKRLSPGEPSGKRRDASGNPFVKAPALNDSSRLTSPKAKVPRVEGSGIAGVSRPRNQPDALTPQGTTRRAPPGETPNNTGIGARPKTPKNQDMSFQLFEYQRLQRQQFLRSAPGGSTQTSCSTIIQTPPNGRSGLPRATSTPSTCKTLSSGSAIGSGATPVKTEHIGFGLEHFSVRTSGLQARLQEDLGDARVQARPQVSAAAGSAEQLQDTPGQAVLDLSEGEDLPPGLSASDPTNSLDSAIAVHLLGQMTNITCGACHRKGHNRKWKYCPHYYHDEEMTRREAEAKKRKDRKEEDVERQRQVAAFTRAREEIARTFNETMSSYNKAIDILNQPQRKDRKKVKKKEKDNDNNGGGRGGGRGEGGEEGGR